MKQVSCHFTKAIIVLFVLQFFVLTIHAQWVKTSGPPGINVNTFFDNGAYLFAGTSAKGAFRSTNNGSRWSMANTGLENVSVFSFIQDSDYLYAGTDKGVYRSSDNGNTWSAANTGLETQRVNAMVFGGGFLFAGTGNGVYRSANQGSSWTIANGNALDYTNIFAMCYVDDVLIVEGDNYLFKTTDAGNSWNVDQGTTQFFQIKHFLVLGDTVIASARNGIFRSKNGGATFTSFMPVEPDELTELLGFSFSNGVIYTADKNGMFQSSDYGVSWNAIAATGLRTGSRFYNYFIQSGNAFLIGMDELGVFGSADVGHTWQQSLKGLTPAASIDNSMLNIDNNIITGTHSDGVYASENNGDKWKKIGTGNNNDTLSNAIIYSTLSPAPGVLLAGTCGDGLYASANSGKTWKHITKGLPYKSAGNYECDETLVKSGSNVIAGTSNGIYYSTDNGKSWNSSNLIGDRIIINAIAANGNVAVAGVFEGVSPFQSGLYRSTNSGVTWTFVQTIRDIVSMSSDSAGTFYAGTYVDIWRSTNNGTAWNTIGNGIPNGTGAFTIKAIGTNNVFVGNNKGIFFSSNKGNNFSNANTGLDPEPNNVVQGLTANDKYLFAGLYLNGVWRRPLSDFGIATPVAKINTTSTDQNKTADNSDNKLSVYPNPATDKTTIQFKAYTAGKFQFVIMSETGKTVMQWNTQLFAGIYNKTINVKNLSPGIYFVRVLINGKSNLAKLSITR